MGCSGALTLDGGRDQKLRRHARGSAGRSRTASGSAALLRRAAGGKLQIVQRPGFLLDLRAGQLRGSDGGWEEPTAALDAFLQRSLTAYGAALAGRARAFALGMMRCPLWSFLPIPRAGQLALARAAFRRARGEDSAEALRFGKTLGVLFGALKALQRPAGAALDHDGGHPRRAFLRTLRPTGRSLRVVSPRGKHLCLAADGVCRARLSPWPGFLRA